MSSSTSGIVPHGRSTPNSAPVRDVRPVGLEPRPEDHYPNRPQAERGSAVRVWAFGMGAALFGAGVYAAIVTLTHYAFGFAAAGLGLVVAWSIRVARPALRPWPTRATGVLLTLVSVLLSEYIIARQFAGIADAPLLVPVRDAGMLVRDDVTAHPVTLLFWGIALVTAAGQVTGSGWPPLARHTSSDDGQEDREFEDGWDVVGSWPHWKAVAAAATVAGVAALVSLGTHELVPAPAEGTSVPAADVPGPAPRDGSLQVTRASNVPFSDVQVGDCFLEPTSDSVTDLRVVPCRQAHDSEVTYKVFLPAGPYPGDDAVNAASDRACAWQLDQYAGSAANKFDEGYFSPTQDNWAEDRSVVCYLTRSAGVPQLVGSNRAPR